MNVFHVACLTKLVGDDFYYVEFPEFPHLNGGKRPKTITEAAFLVQDLLGGHFESMGTLPEPTTTWEKEAHKMEHDFKERRLLVEQFDDVLFLDVKCHGYGMGIACVVPKDRHGTGDPMVAGTPISIYNQRCAREQRRGTGAVIRA